MSERSFEVDGNRLRLLPDGPDRLEALIHLIEGAKRSLRLLYYIYTDGAAGRWIADAATAAAKRGVAVSLVVDGMGSEPADARHFFEPLRAAGISLCRFTPRFGRRYLLRNHQKLAVADEARAIIGGFNVADDYFGTVDERAWRDLGLAIDGPAVGHLAGYFDALAEWSARERSPIRQLNHTLRHWSQPQGRVRWLFGGPVRRLNPWARTLRHDMRRATQFDLIAGYFAPNPAMLRRLDRLAARGQVRLVLPARTDHQIAVSASRFTYAGLLRKGVEVYEYQATKLHSKLVRADNAVYLGSANFDIRSLYLNLEVMLRIEDAAFAAHVRDYFDGEVAHSERITPALNDARSPWFVRVKQAGAYFVMAVADLNLTRRLTGEGWDGRG